MKTMYTTVFAVLVSACVIPAQFQFSKFSQFIPSSAPLVASGRVLFTPVPISQDPAALSIEQSHSLKSLFSLKAPPLPEGNFNASPKLQESPLRALGSVELDNKAPLIRDGRLIEGNLGNQPFSEGVTSSPLLASPTTIKFTLDDVPDFLEPSIFPPASSRLRDGSQISSKESIAILNNPLQGEVKGTKISANKKVADTKQHLFILTSTENNDDASTWKPSTPFLNDENAGGKEQTSTTFSSVLQGSSSNFRPSFVLPFLSQPSKDQNLFTVTETRNPSASFLRSDAPHLLESEPTIFALNPIKVGSEDAEEQTVTDSQVSTSTSLSKTPVPVPIIFSEEESTETAATTTTTTDKPQPTRKTFHFEQEFLSLLKKNSPKEKAQPQKDEPSFEVNPFWFREPINNNNNNGIWRLKGGKRTPSLDLDSQDSVVSQITLKNALGGLFATSIKGLTPVTPNEAALKILDDREDSVTGPGITVKSLAQGGLSGDIEGKGITTTVKPLLYHHKLSEPPRLKLSNTSQRPTTQTEPTSHGPQIVPVGEVGEVPHGDDGATASTVPSLSATLKHGVQSLNVTAWVSGCPKLYGKAELHCTIEHDALSNTAMTLLWKKKSFTEGRPQEHIMTENDLLMMEDDRYSLEHRGDKYVLTIKDFRPKDCGTYECEAKAADTTAASQLLLFTCH